MRSTSRVCSLLVGCAGRPLAQSIEPIEPLDEPVPPPATFRWSLTPIACHEDLRSSVETCQTRDANKDDHVVAVFVPVSNADPKVAVIRYEGQHVGGPLGWQQSLDFGSAPHSAVVTVVRDAVVAAAISNGAVRVVTLDSLDGRVLGRALIVARGAMSVQLEGADQFARIHVRTQTGGTVAVIHPRNARVVVQREVDEHFIIERALPVVQARATDITVGWENRRLVVRNGDAWKHDLALVIDERDQGLDITSVQIADDRVLVPVHHIGASKVEVFAFHRVTGHALWRTNVTTTSWHAITGVHVRAVIAGDLLVVQGSSRLESFVCTIGIADGVERACVDQLEMPPADTFIDFDDDVVTP